MLLTAASTTAKACKMPRYPSIRSWVNQPGPIQVMEYYAAKKKVGVDANVLLLRDIRHTLFEKEEGRTVCIVKIHKQI